MEHQTDSDNNCNWCTWNDPQRLGKEAGGVRNQRMNQDHPNYCIVEVSWNTEKSPGVSSERSSANVGMKNL